MFCKRIPHPKAYIFFDDVPSRIKMHWHYLSSQDTFKNKRKLAPLVHCLLPSARDLFAPVFFLCCCCRRRHRCVVVFVLGSGCRAHHRKRLTSEDMKCAMRGVAQPSVGEFCRPHFVPRACIRMELVDASYELNLVYAIG